MSHMQQASWSIMIHFRILGGINIYMYIGKSLIYGQWYCCGIYLHLQYKKRGVRKDSFVFAFTFMLIFVDMY